MNDTSVRLSESSAEESTYLLSEPEFKVEGVSNRYRWYVFTVLFLLMMFDYADRMVLSSVQELIKVEWDLTDAQLGMFSTIIWVTVGFLALPVSVIVDRWSRRKSISIMAVTWSLACMASRFATGFGQLLTLRGILGAGEAGYSSGAYPLLSAYFSREHRARILGFFNTSIPIGGGLGMMLGGLIAAHWGWRAAFGVVAIPGLIFAVLAWFIKDYENVPIESSSQSPVKTSLKEMWKILKIPTFMFNTIGSMCHDIAYTGLMVWNVSFISRTRPDMTNKSAAMMAGLIMLMALIGAPLGGLIADWFYKKTPKGRNYTAAISCSLMSVMVLFYCQAVEAESLAFFIGVGLITGITITLYMAADNAINQDIVDQRHRGMVWGLRMFFTFALGGGVGILLTGVLSDMFDSLKLSIMVISSFGFISAISYIIGSRFYEQDLANVKVFKLGTEKKD
ncbi:MAG: MFS transporter [Desulfobacula sp.]|nr:MFS transporter [Desulfobacula sp.]